MIDAERIHALVLDSLYRNDELAGLAQGEVPPGCIQVEGIVKRVGFNPERLESHRDEVKGFLSQLAPNFFANSGGGWSFLNLPFDAAGVQWGEQLNAEDLCLLAIGLKLMAYVMGRGYWDMFPGSVPYVVIDLESS